MHFRRFDENPIIHAGLGPSLGTNINGPSLIRVPDWVEAAMGKYYLYFGHHGGQYIRLAYADDLHGPWRIHVPGALHIDQTACVGHIASPDLHVDHEAKRIHMYFHGVTDSLPEDHQGQRTFHASSSTGTTFEADTTILGPFYFRVFQYDGWHYAIAKTVEEDGGGVLLRSKDGVSPFEQGQDILPRQRHVALRLTGNTLDVFYSRGEDAPEGLLLSRMPLMGDWRTWQASEPVKVLQPELDYEGGHLPIEPSSFGAVHQPVHQLRDPAIFEEDGKTYLLYSVAGECGIAIAELTEY